MNSDIRMNKTICLYFDAEAVYITKTGWGDFHVIRELGDINQSVYARMTEAEVYAKYKVNPNINLNNDTRTLN